MRESLREAYSSFYSVRDSKSASPTTGRIHKQRESFGPTVCLISKNTESFIEDVSEDKTRIFLLIIEIERLNKVLGLLSQGNRGMVKSKGEESEVELLKKQIMSLKGGFERSENDKFAEIERQNKVIHSQSARLSEYEAQLNQNNRNLREFESSQSELREQIKYLETERQRAKVDASKIHFDSMLRSQTDLQKSFARDKTSAEMELWKEKLSKYENMINEQKAYINDQKRMIDKLTNTELEIRQRYDYEVSMLKKGNQDMELQIQKMEREASNKILNTSAEVSKELGYKQREMERLRERNEEVSKENQELKTNLATVSKSKIENTEEMRALILELRESLDVLNFDYSNQAQRQEQLNSENNILKKELQFLRSQLDEMKRNFGSKIDDLNEEVESKENEIRKIRRNRKGHESLDSKLKRSSISDTNIRIGTSIKEPLVDLKEIMRDVAELQDSNSRVNRLIESHSRKEILSHRVYNYSNYGL